MNWIIIWNLNEYGLSQCNTNFLHMYLVCCESPQVTSVISPLLLLLLPEPPHQATTNLLPLRPVPPWPTPTLPTPPSFRPLSLHPRLKGKILSKASIKLKAPGLRVILIMPILSILLLMLGFFFHLRYLLFKHLFMGLPLIPLKVDLHRQITKGSCTVRCVSP